MNYSTIPVKFNSPFGSRCSQGDQKQKNMVGLKETKQG